ncbi:MAG: YtxH domain-containing protein, partial [Chloroflexota bacterium]|nr:YtxH domain-containing protein [Chloroflexota bacterium]
GAVCGALIGSVTALLLAPESGEKLRQQIGERTGAFRDEVQGAYTTRLTQLEAELEKLREPKKAV